MAKNTKLKKRKPILQRPWLMTFLISGALIVFGVIIIFSLLPKPFIEQADPIDKASVINARNTNEPQYEQDRSSRITVLSNAGIISSLNSDYSSKVDTCYTNHNDAGWTISNWYQDCYFRYVDLFQTSLSRAEIMQKLAALPISDTFGFPYTFSATACDLYDKRSKPTLSYLTWNLSDTKSTIDCIPDLYQGVFTVKGSIVLDKTLAAYTHSYRTFTADSVDKNKSYIAMQIDHYYFNGSLGCPGSGFLGCSAQLLSPVTGF